MANEKNNETKQAAAEPQAPVITKEEAEGLKNDVLKSVVGGDSGDAWLDGWLNAQVFGKWTSA
jgi:hypothetical protein